jgi:hypothetical protein
MAVETYDLEAATPDQRERLLDGLTAHASAVHADILRVVAVADDLDDHKADGALSMADWLTYRYRLSTTTARQWVKAAHALEAMPLVRKQYVEGSIGFEQLVHALSFATPDDDAYLADLLPSLSCFEIERMARQRRRLTDRERDDARREAHLRLRPDRSGLGQRVSGFLPTEDAAYVKTALERRADAIRPDTDTMPWAPVGTRLAQALTDLCAEDMAATNDSRGLPDASVVVVHVPVETLDAMARAIAAINRGPDDHDSDDDPRRQALNATINNDPIDDGAVLRMLCDTTIEFNIDELGGRTVGIGRASKTPPRWLRRRVTNREGGCCRWPGCSRPIRHLHHMRHWIKGGPTNASNLIGVCWHHHHLLHEGGWNATGDADGEVVLSSRYGRVVTTRAGPVAA